jgi:cytochrome c oxidase cbb3-type subunit III
MARQEQDRLLEHDYDGIQEYDNPLPRWWLWIFYATILYVPFYYVAPSPFGQGPGKVARYEAEVARFEARRPPEGDAAALSDEEYAQRAGDPAVVAQGKAVFTQYCVACHMEGGTGGIGPSLVDGEWIHGGAPTQIHHTIVEGVLDKGMPAWGRILRPAEVDAVTAYVVSLPR